MLCRLCGYGSRVLNTRSTANGYGVRRERVCEGPRAHRFSTYELDASLKHVAKRATDAGRVAVLQQNAARSQRDEQMLRELAKGHSVAEVAAAHGVDATTVVRVVRRLTGKNVKEYKREQRGRLEQSAPSQRNALAAVARDLLGLRP